MTEKALRGELQTPAPFGYVLKDGVLIPDAAQSEAVKSIFQLYVHENMDSREIAKHLNDSGILTKKGNRFKKRSVDYILRNPIYAGRIRWSPISKTNYLAETPEGTIITKGFHLPIIDDNTYVLATRRQSAENRRTRGEAGGHYLNGVLKCMRCGGNMYRCGKIFRCGNYLNKKCRFSQGVSTAKIEKLIADSVPEGGKNEDSGEIVSVYFDKQLGTVEIIYT